jgi:hypothetical protein
MRTRKEILTDLIQNKGEVSSLTQELSQYSWDSDETLCVVGLQDILRLLDTSDAMAIEDWANAVEGREDLDFENEEIQEIIHELANPELFGILSKEKILNLRNRVLSSVKIE